LNRRFCKLCHPCTRLLLRTCSHIPAKPMVAYQHGMLASCWGVMKVR
jgi:hypothetical protein